MNQQKGFSLIEVLVSFLLVASLAFSLLQQQVQCKQLLTHLLAREHGFQILEQVDEKQFVKIKNTTVHG